MLKSPQWKQDGKPYKINASVIAKFRREYQPQPQKPKRKTLTQKLKNFVSCLNLQNLINGTGAPLENMDSEETDELDGIIEPLEGDLDC